MNAEKLIPPVLGPPVLSAGFVLAEAAMECSEGYSILDNQLEVLLRRVADDLSLSVEQRARALWYLCRLG